MRRSRRPAPALAILVFTFSTAALTVLLAACGGGTAPPDTSAPSLTITSTTTATSATYHLTGKTKDNVGATKLTYTVDGGPTKTVDLSGGTFDITVTLQAGQNTIDVKVFDAAGNVKDVVFHVTYTPPGATTGDLKVTIQNLPSGSSANVDVTGPSGYSKNVTATTTLTNLVPGTYTVTPHDVFVNLVDFKGTATPGSVDVTAGATASTTVAYTAYYGFLDLTVSGLPSGVNADVTVTGPGGYTQSVTKTTTLSALNKGDYTITANAVTDTTTGDAFSPTVTGSPASVVPGGPHAKASVSYTMTTNHLTIDISGLSGANAAVTVTGPGGYSQPVTATTTLTGLADGTYTIDAASVTSGGSTYQPDKTTQSVSLTGGQTPTVSVAYAVAASTTGSLTLTIGGLLNGTPANVTVSGPTPVSSPVTATTTLNNLTPGTYTITPHDVTGAHYDYAAPAASSVSVTAGASASATVTYTASTGSATLTVAGLPTRTHAGVTMTGPSGGFIIDGTRTLDHLQPGAYTLATQQVAGTDGELYDDASDNNATVSVQVGQTATKTLTYQQVSGDVNVTVVGPASGSVDVTGASNDHVTQTSTLKGLYTGLGGSSYAITVNPVSDANFHWSGSASPASFTLHPGQTVSTTATYTAQDGAISVSVAGLPSGTGANVDLVSPGGTVLMAGQTGKFKKAYLTQGTYTLRVHTVTGPNYSYGLMGRSTDATMSVTVNDGQVATPIVSYQPFTGVLDVTVSSTSSRGITPDVSVTGMPSGGGTPNYGKSITTFGLTTLTGLTPETYLVGATQQTDSHYTYDPVLTPAAGSVAVTAGTAQAATVDYQPIDGAISVSFSGPIPSSASYNATITDGGSYSNTVYGNTLVPYVSAAAYTVTAPLYSTYGNICLIHNGTSFDKYTPTVTPSSFTLAKGTTQAVAVSYVHTSPLCSSGP